MSKTLPKHSVFIDPTSREFLHDNLFDLENRHLNRDDTLLPFVRARRRLAEMGVEVHTADYLRRGEFLAETNHYWSIGLLDGYKEFVDRGDVRLRGFILFEPPLVAPKMYASLPRLSRMFEKVYIHNTIGDGYSLKGVDGSKLQKLHWPLPYDRVVEPAWSRTNRLNRIVVIAGNHNPKWRKPEYYSKRIEAVAALSKVDAIDLYGRGWDRRWSKQSMWLSYWQHNREISASYRGACPSKYDVLGGYRFCLCLENMPMSGYVTEKIYDCFYAGAIPLYLGAPDISKYVDKSAYIDVSRYASWLKMWEHIKDMSDDEVQMYRDSGMKVVERLSDPNNQDANYHWLENVINI
jgi:hypothetical protein